jgi:hypothetical protein
MRKDILKNLSKINQETIPKKCMYEQKDNNIIFNHTHREELIITKKENYTYEELIVYLHNIDALREKKIKINDTYIS